VQDLTGSEPEVSLAVKLPSQSPPGGEDEDEDVNSEEAGDTDDFLSSQGFEFIDLSETRNLPDEEDALSQGTVII
jgi:hypothetical protein